MKYCETTTLNHPVSKKIKTAIRAMNDLFKAEGYNGNIFDDKKVLDLDAVERCFCQSEGRDPRRTMDIAIGLSNQGRSCCILLVELKFKISNPNNIKRAEIDEKIKHSTDILSTDLSIYRNKLFIFSDKITAQAVRHVSRLYTNSPRVNTTIIILTASEFKAKFL